MTPASWVTAHATLLPRRGTALDVACGRGRHALWLAGQGLHVSAMDRDADAIRDLREEAMRRGLPIVATVADLEADGDVITPAAYDIVVVTHYLHRPLIPALLDALRPGGLLIYETFTRAQALRGKPRNPAFLLEDGELLRLVRPLEILDYREGVFEERDVASIVARRA